ncbi:MAG: hypothetical protein WCT37_02885 [Patescibacteria group bacterium]
MNWIGRRLFWFTVVDMIFIGIALALLIINIWAQNDWLAAVSILFALVSGLPWLLSGSVVDWARPLATEGTEWPKEVVEAISEVMAIVSYWLFFTINIIVLTPTPFRSPLWAVMFLAMVLVWATWNVMSHQKVRWTYYFGATIVTLLLLGHVAWFATKNIGQNDRIEQRVAQWMGTAPQAYPVVGDDRKTDKNVPLAKDSKVLAVPAGRNKDGVMMMKIVTSDGENLGLIRRGCLGESEPEKVVDAPTPIPSTTAPAYYPTIPSPVTVTIPPKHNVGVADKDLSKVAGVLMHAGDEVEISADITGAEVFLGTFRQWSHPVVAGKAKGLSYDAKGDLVIRNPTDQPVKLTVTWLERHS